MTRNADLAAGGAIDGGSDDFDRQPFDGGE